MSKDEDFQDMLDNLDIVVESMEDGHTVITPRVHHENRGKTLLELQKELLDPDARQHALYRLYINPTFRKLVAGFVIVSIIHTLLFFFATTLSTPGRNVLEELGELAECFTKGKSNEEKAEELADILILTFGHAIAMDVDLESAFNEKMKVIMKRPAIKGDLGIRITNYKKK